MYKPKKRNNVVVRLKVPTRVSFWPSVYMTYALEKFQPFWPGQPESRQGLPGKEA